MHPCKRSRAARGRRDRRTGDRRQETADRRQETRTEKSAGIRCRSGVIELHKGSSLISCPLSSAPPMPELPEVETMRRGIAAIAGSTIAGGGAGALPAAADPHPAAAGGARPATGRAGGSTRSAGWASGSSCGWRAATADLRAADDGAGAGGRSADAGAPAVPARSGRRADSARLVLGPPRAGLGAADLRERAIRRAARQPQAWARCAGALGRASCASDWPRAGGRSRSRCSTSGPWRGSATCMRRKSCTWRAFTRPSAATC